ncbi:hypothetical protein FOL47_002139 [Perkinsus chesapeaki]|uniref:Maltose/galactoside acetyltransferase domain-containing protein n=1 Tax=Perkinsus chesapeaki TaxID=330153 RepID=A0A7J6MFL3_PERCH|nr:hypothetical protein FOL47_002139 [Perkinsus chesapeaki]
MKASKEEYLSLMRNGKLFKLETEVFRQWYTRAKDLCRAYNEVSNNHNSTARREAILQDLLGSCGSRPDIEPPFRCDFGFNISIGDLFVAEPKLVILDASLVEIGNNVYCGQGVHFYAADHPRAASARATWAMFGRPIKIGDDVCIGANTVIMSGVNIGDGSVIEAGSIVTKDIPSHVVAGGNPCRVVKDIRSC